LTQQRGSLGEAAAARYLKRQGLKVLLRNVRVGPGELDLICRHAETLVIVEVKARQQEAWERPADAVNKRKRKLILQCADAYLKELSRPEINVRFDIVEVILEKDEVSDIRWLRSAFSEA
jgi:putative endonuclease